MGRLTLALLCAARCGDVSLVQSLLGMDGIDADGQMLDEDDKILHQILEGGGY